MNAYIAFLGIFPPPPLPQLEQIMRLKNYVRFRGFEQSVGLLSIFKYLAEVHLHASLPFPQSRIGVTTTLCRYHMYLRV